MARQLFSLTVVLVCVAVGAVLAHPRPNDDVMTYAVNLNGQQASNGACPIANAMPPLSLLCREENDADWNAFNLQDEPVEVASNSMTYNGQSESILIRQYGSHRRNDTTTPGYDAPRN